MGEDEEEEEGGRCDFCLPFYPQAPIVSPFSLPSPPLTDMSCAD